MIPVIITPSIKIDIITSTKLNPAPDLLELDLAFREISKVKKFTAFPDNLMIDNIDGGDKNISY
jgi:hypothetical protein